MAIDKKEIGTDRDFRMVVGSREATMKRWEDFTELEQNFIEEYVTNGLNHAKAYQSCGYKGRDWKHVKKASWEVLCRPHIQREIKKRLKLFHMEEEEMMARHSIDARGDIADAVEYHALQCPSCGHVIHKEGVARISMKKIIENGLSHLVKRYVEYPDGKQQIDFIDIQKARETLMRASGVFDKKEEGLDNLAAVLAEAIRQRNGQGKIDE